MKLQRLIAILTILLQRDRISATALAEKFEVSIRTIYRDMEALEQAGIPIVTHTGINGGFSIVDQYKIDKKLFTHQDIITLLQSLYSISGPLSNAEINRTLEKIKGLVPQEYGKSIELTSRQLYIDMSPWAVNPLVMDSIALIRQALEQNRLIRFDYLARHEATPDRTVEPLQLILKEGNWYLRAWCKKRQDFRIFKLTRIRRPEILQEQFSPREFDNKLNDFKDWQSERLIYVDIRIEESLREEALDFCRDEYMTDLEDGTIAIHMPFVESDMGYGLLLRLGHRCRVIGPDHVREELIHRIEELRNVYCK